MNLAEQQEQRLAQGLRDGRTDAWQAFYDAYAERLWRGAARLLGPQADVADVVQETMLAAARSARGFDPERGSLWQWLWGIARNHVALHLRKQAQYQRLLQASAARAAGNGQPSPPGALAAAEQALLVRATLAELPADYEMLLTARYLDGETVAALAQHEGASEVAVRSKLARARQAFRAAYRKYGPDPIEADHESA